MAEARDDSADAILAASEGGMTQVSLRLPVPVYAAIYRISDSKRVSASAVIRSVLTAFLRRKGRLDQ